MDNVLKEILSELSKKYGIYLTIVSQNEIFSFPYIEEGRINVEEMKEKVAVQNDELNYFIFNEQLFASFKFRSGKSSLLSIIGPVSSQSDSCWRQADSINSSPILVPRISSMQNFFNFISLIHNLLKKKPGLSVKEFMSKEAELHIQNVCQKNLENRRMNDPTLDSIEFEKRYLESIRRNEVDKIEWLIQKASDTYSAKLASRDLSTIKYKYVSIVTLLTRLSIHSGVSDIRAYSLSDSLIQSLESIRNFQDCIDFIRETSFLFIELMHHSPYADKSELIRKILQYIDSNIYEKITLKIISDHLKMSKTYLSSKFKSEMGETIPEYIKHQKISEAEHLLLFTDRNYKEIAQLLNYSSQSHFIRVFKTVKNMTPDEYRTKRKYDHIDLLPHSI